MRNAREEFGVILLEEVKAALDQDLEPGLLDHLVSRYKEGLKSWPELADEAERWFIFVLGDEKGVIAKSYRDNIPMRIRREFASFLEWQTERKKEEILRYFALIERLFKALEYQRSGDFWVYENEHYLFPVKNPFYEESEGLSADNEG